MVGMGGTSPTREYDRSEPIRGVVHWSDGTETKLTYARHVGDAERSPVRIVLDGRHFTEDGIDLTEIYVEDRLDAVVLDGVRFVRADS